MQTTWLKFCCAGFVALTLAACGGGQNAAPTASAATDNAPQTEKKDIVFGTTVGDFGDMVKEQIKPELEKKGYHVKLVEFTDYVRPNLALADGEIDINIFQHKPYLDDFKREHKLDITEAFQVPTAPLGLYSGKLKSLQEVKNGSTVALPNDPSNFARSLVVLDKLGWIKLKDHIDPLTATKTSIAKNIKNINLVELEAAQLPRARADVDFALINGNYATSSGINLTEALFQEPSYAYINWSAIRTADKNSQWVKDVTAAYNSEAFKAYAHKRFAGYKYPFIWNEKQGNTTAASAASATH